MQKHERAALDAAREEAAKAGWSVDMDFPKGPRRRLVLHTPAGDRYKFVSTSPRDGDAQRGFAVRWVRQTIKELHHG